MGKTDDGFDAATFAQRFSHLGREYGPRFKEIYSHMRAHCPVTHTDELGGFWVVTRYADIMRAACDHEAFASRYGVRLSVKPAIPRARFGPLGEERTGPLALAYPPGPNGEAPRLGLLPLELDPPLHGLYREAIDPLFSPHAVSELAPWLLTLTDQLIDAIIEKGEGDFSRDLSTPLASICTMRILGLPLGDWSDYAWFIQSANGGSSSVQPRTRNPSERELRERVAAEVVRQRSQLMANGAIAHLIGATVDGRKLDSWEIEATIWVIIGTLDATQAGMGSGFVWLSRNPEQRRRLAETPRLMPHALEEFLRVFSPAHARSRTVMRDVELAGQTLKPGDRALLPWVSGNLDETEFANPEEVDFDRANKRHMAFGLGPHRCIGADIVRLEFLGVFGRILNRMPDFRVDEAAAAVAGASQRSRLRACAFCFYAREKVRRSPHRLVSRAGFFARPAWAATAGLRSSVFSRSDQARMSARDHKVVLSSKSMDQSSRSNHETHRQESSHHRRKQWHRAGHRPSLRCRRR
jgi:cytochrome P450